MSASQAIVPHGLSAARDQGAIEAPGTRALRGPIVPIPMVKRDRALPLLIVVSLVAHATVLLPALLGPRTLDPLPPREIPVEIVQLPSNPVAPPKPPLAPAKAPQINPAQKHAEPRPARPEKMAAKAAPKPVPVPASERLKNLLGPMPALALPAAAGDGTEEVSYAQLVMSQVAKAKKQGRYRGVPGAASVAFTIGDTGELATVAIVRTSGDSSLDEEAVAMIKRGAPYPPPPPGGRRDYRITLRFEPLI